MISQLKRVPPHSLEGLRAVYSQLEVFICSKSISSLEVGSCRACTRPSQLLMILDGLSSGETFTVVIISVTHPAFAPSEDALEVSEYLICQSCLLLPITFSCVCVRVCVPRSSSPSVEGISALLCPGWSCTLSTSATTPS